MRIYSGTITGPAHILRGEKSQDSFGYYTDDDFTIIVAADGAGSLRESKAGSQFAVDEVIRIIKDSYNSSISISENLVESITERLISSFKDLENYKNMGCTISYALIDNDTFEYGIGIVGDAFAVVHEQDGGHTLFINEQDGEYANITQLLSSDSIKTFAKVGEGFRGLSVSTDGLLHTSVRGSEASVGFWNSIMSRIDSNTLDLNNFFEYMNGRELIDDDTTLVIAVGE